jgi:hypothetical protein
MSSALAGLRARIRACGPFTANLIGSRWFGLRPAARKAERPPAATRPKGV